MCFRGNEPESDKVPEQSARLCTYLDLCECTSSPNLSGFSLLPARLRLSARTVKAIWATGPLVMRHDPDALKCKLKDTHMHTCMHTPSRDTGITFITRELSAAVSASTGSGVQLPCRRPKVHPVASFQGKCNLSGSSPVRRAAGIHASVYSAAKQSRVSIKTFDRNSQISCRTWSVLQTTAGGSKVEQNAEEEASTALHPTAQYGSTTSITHSQRQR